MAIQNTMSIGMRELSSPWNVRQWIKYSIYTKNSLVHVFKSAMLLYNFILGSPSQQFKLEKFSNIADILGNFMKIIANS